MSESKPLNFVTSVIGKPKPKTLEQLAAEAAAEKERIADANAIPMTTFKITPTTTTISTPPPYKPPVDAYRVNVGGRRRKSRRGKSRKYKRTLKRRKNKTKNRK